MSERKLALVTGASSGIGADLARELAAGGHDLILVARGVDKLRALGDELQKAHGVVAHVIGADLARPDAAAVLASELEARKLEVEVLINNAGYALYGQFVEIDAADQLRMIQVNVVTLTQLTQLLLPKMLARKSGRVLNVASTAAFQPGPLMAVYYATKAYVLSFSEALANEVAGSGVTVTALCPGPTRTGFQTRAKMEESKLVRGKEIMTSAEVARIGYRALMKGKTVIIPGASNKLLAQAVRFLPRNTVTKMVRSAQERAPH